MSLSTDSSPLPGICCKIKHIATFVKSLRASSVPYSLMSSRTPIPSNMKLSFSFLRPDIEAYEHVVKQVCGNDETLRLQENFRSHAGIIEVVNQLFDGRIMVEQPGLQPRYVPIQ